MTPNKKQKEIIDMLISQAKFWKSTNDIMSPTHYNDIEEEVVEIPETEHYAIENIKERTFNMGYAEFLGMGAELSLMAIVILIFIYDAFASTMSSKPSEITTVELSCGAIDESDADALSSAIPF